MDRRAGRQRPAAQLRRPGPAVGPGGDLARRAGRRQGRPRRADARQPGRTVGVNVGGRQARYMASYFII